MKFTREQAFQDLKAALGNTQKISDRSINETLDTLMPSLATEDTELVDFLKIVKPIVVTTNGNMIKDTSDFVKDYETKHPAPTPIVTPIVPPVDDMPAWAKTLLDDQKSLKEQLAAKDKLVARQAKLNEATNLIRSKANGTVNDEVLGISLALIGSEITDEMTVDEIVTKGSAMYDTKYSKLYGEDTGVPGTGNGGNGSGKAGLEAFKAKKIAEHAIPDIK